VSEKWLLRRTGDKSNRRLEKTGISVEYAYGNEGINKIILK